MADVTVNSRKDAVEGSYRVVYFDVSAAATGDTIRKEDIGLNNIVHVTITPATAIACGYTLSSGDIALAYSGGGAAANLKVRVLGN